jgi:hypothetical protein
MHAPGDAQALVDGGSGLLAINQSIDTSNKPFAAAGIPQRTRQVILPRGDRDLGKTFWRQQCAEPARIAIPHTSDVCAKGMCSIFRTCVVRCQRMPHHRRSPIVKVRTLRPGHEVLEAVCGSERLQVSGVWFQHLAERRSWLR